MLVEDDEKYHALAELFQREQIVRLRDCLKSHGVDATLTREICGDFTFDLSMLLN